MFRGSNSCCLNPPIFVTAPILCTCRNAPIHRTSSSLTHLIAATNSSRDRTPSPFTSIWAKGHPLVCKKWWYASSRLKKYSKQTSKQANKQTNEHSVKKCISYIHSVHDILFIQFIHTIVIYYQHKHKHTLDLHQSTIPLAKSPTLSKPGLCKGILGQRAPQALQSQSSCAFMEFKYGIMMI
jgi:hypothetical protein